MSKIISHCANCNTPRTHDAFRAFTYCGQKCATEHRNKKRDEEIEAGAVSTVTKMRSYLISNQGHVCQECKKEEWLGLPIPLELEHVDGNSSNTVLANCKMICPNCHSQTPTYKNRNKGNGRFARRERYQAGKSF